MIDGWGISGEIALGWVSLHPTDVSTLVQVMAWCHQATSHYLSQCWPSCMSPFAVIRPQRWPVINKTKLNIQYKNMPKFTCFNSNNCSSSLGLQGCRYICTNQDRLLHGPSLVRTVNGIWDMASNWLVSPLCDHSFVWSKYSLGMHKSQCPLDSHDRWEFPPFIKGHRQSLPQP